MSSPRSFAHYSIVEKIGAGGMGEVFRATDSKLNRDVALKMLPDTLIDNAERLARFQREAQVLAQLNHPGIAAIYGLESEGSRHALAMELVEGPDLSTKLEAGSLPVAEVLDIALQLAEAIGAAHAKGIVHRDLKPANIKINTEGRVKVLDFGLAKSADEKDTSAEAVTRDVSLTKQGVAMGTAPYMAPEQLRGMPVDQRGDIFALGILLYEMTVGQRPFVGATNVDVTSSILRDDPQLLIKLKPDLPRHLGRIVAQCLEKQPEDRYQSVIEVRNALRFVRRELETESAPATARRSPGTILSGRRRLPWVGLAVFGAVACIMLAMNLGRTGGPLDRSDAQDSARPPAPQSVTGPASNSVAVLPFTNMTADPQQDYLSDGIAEELLNLLTRIPRLKVAARMSSFSFRDQDLDIKEVARRLDVTHVLIGSVRRSEHRLRIAAQLIRADSGFNVWSETYDRTLDDVFVIQEEIATDVARRLEVTLLEEAPRVPETDPAAYALFLQGRHLIRLGTEKSFEEAVEFLQQVLEIDPNYARAWADLAGIYGNQAGVGLRQFDEGYTLSRAAALRALEIAPDLATGHARLGWISMFYDGDLEAAALHLRRALEIEPANIAIIRSAATLLKYLGRLDEAIELGEFAVARDPADPNSHSSLGFAYFYAGRWDDAIASYRTALSLSPGRIGVPYYLASSLLFSGKKQAALEAIRGESFELFRLAGLALVHHALGNEQESRVALEELIRKYEREAAYNIAYVLAELGQADDAFARLEDAMRYGDSGLGDIVVDPRFRDLHDDPRWRPFLQELARDPAQLAAISFQVAAPSVN